LYKLTKKKERKKGTEKEHWRRHKGNTRFWHATERERERERERSFGLLSVQLVKVPIQLFPLHVRYQVSSE